MEPSEAVECDVKDTQHLEKEEHVSCGVGDGVDLHREGEEEQPEGFSCSSSADEFDFEFEFAPLHIHTTAADADAAADADDDVFHAGHMFPTQYYPVFARPHPDDQQDHKQDASTSQHESTAAPPEIDNYCVWVPKKPSSSSIKPTAEAHPESTAAWKSRSAGAVDSSKRWRLRDIMHATGRSHSDGTEKFAFLAPVPRHSASRRTSAATAAAGGHATTAGSSKTGTADSSSKRQTSEHGRQKKGPTEMDIVTAHRLYYSKNGAGAAGGAGGAGSQSQHHRQSYLPYRKDLVGYFSSGGNSGPHTRFLPF